MLTSLAITYHPRYSELYRLALRDGAPRLVEFTVESHAACTLLDEHFAAYIGRRRAIVAGRSFLQV